MNCVRVRRIEMISKIIVTFLMFISLTLLGFANGIYFIAVKAEGLKDYIHKNTLLAIILMDIAGVVMSIGALYFIAKG
jgi:hypothetical protein